MNDPKKAAGRSEDLDARYAGLMEDARGFSRLMAGYVFYFIKNILSYKLILVIKESGAEPDVLEYGHFLDVIFEKNEETVITRVEPDMLKFLCDLSENGARCLMDSIFSAAVEVMYKDVYTVFTGLADPGGIYGAGAALNDFCRLYLNSEKAYRRDIFGPWSAELEYSAGSFKSALSEEAYRALKKLMNEYEISRNYYHLKKIVSENSQIADELILSFSNIKTYYEENEGIFLPCGDFGIIKGIYDTILIKLESIKENKDEYLAAAGEKFTEYGKNAPLLTKEESSGITGEIYAKWLEYGGFADGIINKVAESAFFLSYRERVVKYAASARDAFARHDMDYKRENLLYEVSTYGEIMNYSVSRLKGSGDEAARDFAGVCERVYGDISVAIQKNNISLINPAPREQFNGREHEVLFAEESEEFAKGEIIKVLNPGYKKGDLVLARANVIAAK